MPELIFHPDVSVEIKASYQWYEKQAKGLGEDFLAELQQSFGVITQYPNSWPPFGNNIRRFLLNKFPFSVIYSPSEKQILVLAVMHNKKRPGYWIKRSE